MAGKVIITVARQYGSGGREIGERVAELLSIKAYDRELITMSIEGEDGIAHETAESVDEVFGAANHFGHHIPLNDRLFILQSDLIRRLAKQDSCVIIGRCADYVLREDDARLSVFIYGDIADRKKRIAQRHSVSEDEALELINKTDRRRASYYNFYTGGKWGRYDNYHIALCSSTLGIDTCAEVIAAAARKIMEK